MAPTIRQLRADQHPALGDVISRSSEDLINRWADRAREEQPTARRVHHDVLVDHLPDFLKKLGRSLKTAGDDADTTRSAETHGDQRWDTGWSITEVVRDYQILRLVLCEFLEEQLGRRLDAREALVLNVAIDDAIAAAVSSYVASQSLPVAAAAGTREEALDLLLNVLGGVGHELRNPLAPLTNSLEILRIAGHNPARVEATRLMMSRQLRVLSRLVEDLMDLPRLARGKMSLSRDPVDLAPLLRACAEDRREVLAVSGLNLDLHISTGPVLVTGDETRLTQVFGNLIGNAQKFTDRGGTVTVTLTAEAGRARVVVRDTGVGIDPAALPTVFEAYSQADRTLARSRGGLGLGLALVKGVVELLGGSVAADSAGVGAGATFTVEIPLRADAAAGASAALPEHGGRRRRVLVIEDNRDSAESVRDFLQLYGHSVDVAFSGAEGIRLASREPRPEVVICDVGLPGMDGYTVAAELRRTVPNVVVIAVTGHGARTDGSGESDRLFDYYLLKPVDPDRLARLLATDFETK